MEIITINGSNIGRELTEGRVCKRVWTTTEKLAESRTIPAEITDSRSKMRRGKKQICVFPINREGRRTERGDKNNEESERTDAGSAVTPDKKRIRMNV